jgi:hypothetical protein
MHLIACAPVIDTQLPPLILHLSGCVQIERGQEGLTAGAVKPSERRISATRIITGTKS